MKKGQPAPQVTTQEEEETKEIPQSGFGRFEYQNQTLYVGNWKLQDGIKVKHGHGKINFFGSQSGEIGAEEYEGDWENDKMHGYGVYKFTSGNVYTGQWKEGKMDGLGKMQYMDGSSYDGQWEGNLMHGEGTFIDQDKVHWHGIFQEGCFESKIQKKLQAEKLIQDKKKQYIEKAKNFFVQFQESFAKSDKKTFKENLHGYFAQADNCEYINSTTHAFPKYEDKTPDKWNELLKLIYDEGNCKIVVLGSKEDTSTVPQEAILIEQLRQKIGGQIVEVEAVVGEKTSVVALCELASEQWVLVYCGEK